MIEETDKVTVRVTVSKETMMKLNAEHNKTGKTLGEVIDAAIRVVYMDLKEEKESKSDADEVEAV